MSGGHWNYQRYRIEEQAEVVRTFLRAVAHGARSWTGQSAATPSAGVKMAPGLNVTCTTSG